MPFFNPFASEPTPAPNANPTPSPDPSPDPPAPADPNTIPEKMDLNFFNSLVKETPPNEPGQPLSVSKDILTPENLRKISEGQNFSNAIPQEVLEKLQKGDGAATMEAVEHIARAAHAAALSQTGAIIDTVLQQQGNSLESQIKKNVNDSLSLRDITADVPNIDQPIVRSHFEMVSSQFREKFPNATADQIRTMSKNYFTELSSAINPQSPPSDPSKPAKQEVDWMAYAGFAPPSS